MEAVIIVTVLALMQFYWFGIEVGSMRAKHGCKAPATTGAPEFERMFRVQQNTMEQLVMFLPALWMYASLVNPLWGAGMVYLPRVLCQGSGQSLDGLRDRYLTDIGHAGLGADRRCHETGGIAA
jgi:hypothetical protein